MTILSEGTPVVPPHHCFPPEWHDDISKNVNAVWQCDLCGMRWVTRRHPKYTYSTTWRRLSPWHFKARKLLREAKRDLPKGAGPWSEIVDDPAKEAF